MAFIEDMISGIGNFLSGGGNPQDIRSNILAALPQEEEPEPVQEEQQEEVQAIRQPMLPEAVKFNEPDRFEVPDFEDAEEKEESLAPFTAIDTRPEFDIQVERDRAAADADIAVQDIKGDRLGLTQTKGMALSSYVETLKRAENPNKKGLVNEGGKAKFTMFESIEEKKEKGQSKYEIGYGIKVMDSWLKDDPKGWPVIDGVPTDVRKGLTIPQVDSLLSMRAGKDRAVASSQLKTWTDMTEEEKLGWMDLTYNGGSGAIKLNPKARAAANAGYTMEGLARLFDYTKAGNKKYRGLLKRRLNQYNQAALSVTGAPVIEEYKWGEEVWVKFSSSLISEKFSKKFRDKINKKDGWYKVPGKGEGATKHVKVGEDFQF